MLFSVITELYNHYHNPILKHFYHLKKKAVPLAVTLHHISQFAQLWTAPNLYSESLDGLFWTFHIMVLYVTFVTCFFYLTHIQCSSMYQYAIPFHC